MHSFTAHSKNISKKDSYNRKKENNIKTCNSNIKNKDSNNKSLISTFTTCNAYFSIQTTFFTTYIPTPKTKNQNSI
jgi:hypothetical protein